MLLVGRSFGDNTLDTFCSFSEIISPLFHIALAEVFSAFYWTIVSSQKTAFPPAKFSGDVTSENSVETSKHSWNNFWLAC